VTAVWLDQSGRMKGDRFVCGDCGARWPTVVIGPPFDCDICRNCGGLLTAIWDVFPGDNHQETP
jgi:ribosomal protein L40E